MVTTTGIVQRLGWAQSIRSVCAWIGPSPTSSELLVIQLDPRDSRVTLRSKRSMINLLANALTAGYPVMADHGDADATILSVTCGDFDICPMGRAVISDAYTVSGTRLPADA